MDLSFVFICTFSLICLNAVWADDSCKDLDPKTCFQQVVVGINGQKRRCGNGYFKMMICPRTCGDCGPSKRENAKRECDCHDFNYDLITPDCEADCTMQEFCSEACLMGIGGPECGCANHPSGKREGLSKKRENVKRECDCHDFNYDLITPDCEADCTMQEFCSMACPQGLAGKECNCPDHPIGKRGAMAKKYRRTMKARTMMKKLSIEK